MVERLLLSNIQEDKVLGTELLGGRTIKSSMRPQIYNGIWIRCAKWAVEKQNFLCAHIFFRSAEFACEYGRIPKKI